jgi:hypothetical protein
MTRTTRRHSHPPLAPVIPLPAAGPANRNRAGARRRTVPPARRPVSVWLCTPPAGQPANRWLDTAVSTATTTYTSPGHRVLLLTPPTTPTTPGRTDPPSPAAPRATTGPDRDHDPELVGEVDRGLDRLRRTADAVTSTGRLVIVRTAQPPDRHPATNPANGPSPSPDPDSADAAASTESRTGPDRLNRPDPPQQLDLVITTTRPHTTGWLPGMPWTRLLTPHGLLAVITHSDTRGGQLTDPIRPLNRAATRAGLALLDHVILAHPAPPPAFSTDPSVGSAPDWAHADLLIFANPADAATGATR